MYTLQLTEEQLSLVLRAVDLMMRTGMGQCSDLAKWIATKGNSLKFDTNKEFEEYLTTKNIAYSVLEGLMYGCQVKGLPSIKSDDTLNLHTLYSAIRHEMWKNEPDKSNWDIRAQAPIQWGKEPIPIIKKE